MPSSDEKMRSQVPTHKPLEVDAYGAKTKGGIIEALKATLPPLTASQVQIEMTHCGTLARAARAAP